MEIKTESQSKPGEISPYAETDQEKLISLWEFNNLTCPRHHRMGMSA